MAAVFESHGSRRKDKTVDLLEAGKDLLAGHDEDISWEASEIFRQLRCSGEGGKSRGTGNSGDDEASVVEVWLSAFKDRLASNPGSGQVYGLADGRKALLPLGKTGGLPTERYREEVPPPKAVGKRPPRPDIHETAERTVSL